LAVKSLGFVPLTQIVQLYLGACEGAIDWDGAADGAADGTADGENDGTADGENDGKDDGENDGAAVSLKILSSPLTM
jgi:hypothetical protein